MTDDHEYLVQIENEKKIQQQFFVYNMRALHSVITSPSAVDTRSYPPVHRAQ